MPDVKDPKTSGAIIREPEAAGIPIERKDLTGKDIGAEPAKPTTAGAVPLRGSASISSNQRAVSARPMSVLGFPIPSWKRRKKKTSPCR